MSIDILQEKIRKLKNPSVVELMLPLTDLPPRYAHDAKGYGEFCRDLLGGLKGIIPAFRLSFGAFALLGGEGLQDASTPQPAGNQGHENGRQQTHHCPVRRCAAVSLHGWRTLFVRR